MAPARWTPIEWPAAWDAPTLLRILNGTPFNCVVSDRTQGGLPDTLKRMSPRWRAWSEVDWSSPGDPVAVSNAFWPDLQRKGGDSEQAGPTGTPWLDSNGWLIELLRARAPGATEIWIKSAPPENATGLTWNHYRLALCEAFAYGARRPVWLAPHHASALARGDADAQRGWQSLCRTAAWLDELWAWQSFVTESSLVVLSDFAGPNEYIASETLLLCSRRGLAFTPCDPAHFSATVLQSKRVLLYTDQQPLTGTRLALVRSFVAQGGIFIALPSSGRMLDDLQHIDEPHPRFHLHALGRGRVALAKEGFDDPWLLAQDAHLLVSKQYDAARLYNGGSLQCRFAVAPDRKRALAHLINYTTRPSINQTTLSISLRARKAQVHIAGEKSQPAAVRAENGRTEVQAPPFDIYSAVEFELISPETAD